MAINFSQELNQEQLDVVLQGEGPCLVLAGAGSGKTRTITYRVAYLLEQGVKPENILLVTFTNKAAEEMKMRVARLAADHGRGGVTPPLPWSGTFHHIAYRILRIYAPILGYGNNFSVLDSDDSESLLKMCVKGVGVETGHAPSLQRGRFPSASVIGAMISYSRNAELPLDQVIEERFYQWVQCANEIKTIADAYTKRKKEANAMDFDDLLVNLLHLLSGSRRDAPMGRLSGDSSVQPETPHRGVSTANVGQNPVLKKYAEQFRYILVDEYQDTNKIQASIIKQFASVHKNVLVVGDDAQSIYSFRAADIKNILRFEKEYPGAKIFKLETNYRSTQPILEVANSVIENNPNQYKKNLHVADRRGGVTPPLQARPALYPQIDQQSEAQFIVKKIVDHMKEGIPPEEIAVLFRAAHHSQMLEVELVQAGIEYEYRGGVRFFERAHIKDILSYLRILNNLADTAAWLRVLMHEEGIGPAAAQKVIEAVREIVRANAGVQNIEPLRQVADIGYQILGGKAQVGWGNFVKIWQAMAKTVGVGVENFQPQPMAPGQLIQFLLQSPYREYLEGEFVDARDRLDDIKQLAVFAARYESLEEFLANTSLQESFRMIANDDPSSFVLPPAGEGNRSPSPSGRGARGEGSVSQGKIVLSTIHQAKGLEWSAVFIINLSAGGFPNDRALREENGLEEERRLFYVAITRAKKYLYLTYPMAGGAFGDFMSGPSVFLNEIEPGLLEDHSLLSTDSTVLDDPDADVRYISEDGPKKIRPRSFLADIEDL